MKLEDVAYWLFIEGYSYGAIATYANEWDCSFEDAMLKLFDALKSI